MTPRVVIRADASPAIGVGHVMRTLALAEALRALGAEVRFATRADLGAGLVAARGFPAALLPDADEAGDADRTTALGADLVLVDHYGLGPTWWRRVGEAVPLAAIDDTGRDGIGAACRVVVNTNLGAEAIAYPGGARVLAGPAHALLRPQVAALPRSPSRDPGTVLVSLGGADIAGLTPGVVTTLRSRAALRRAVMVIGPGFRPEVAAASRAAAAGDPRFVIAEAPASLAPLLAEAALLVSTASSTLHEALFLGTVPLAFVVADNQERIGAALQQLQAGILLGAPGPAAWPRLADSIDRLLADDEARLGLARRGMELVDGQGARRVAEALLAAVPKGPA